MGKTVNKADEMLFESIPKLILKYSSVIFCSLLFNELYNIVDALFVSKGIDDNAMGGVSVIYPFMMVQGAVSQTIGSGAAPIVSGFLGKGKNKKAGSVTANAMLAFYTVSILITVFGLIFIEPLLKLFGATEDIMPYAKEYFTVILIGNVFSTGFSSIIRAEGRMVYSLLIWLIPTAVNIALDGVFIYGAHIGVKGAALATVISYFTSFLMSVIFFKKISVQKFENISFSFKTVCEIITLGVPMLIQMGGTSLLFMMINKVLSLYGGTLYVNTFAYVSKIITFAVVAPSAAASAISPVISCNCGAGKIKRVNKAFKVSLIMCEAYAFAVIAVSLFLSDSLIKIFTENGSIISLGGSALRTLAPALIFTAPAILAGASFQAAGRRIPALITNSLILIFSALLIPLSGALKGIDSIYACITAACIISGVTAVILVKALKIYKPKIQ